MKKDTPRKDIEDKKKAEAQEKEAPEKAEEAGPEELAARLEEAEAMLKEKEDQVLRIAAEMDNFKKRLAKEKEEFCRFANESFAKDLLAVMDGLDKALDHSGTNEREVLLNGVRMTRELLLDVMAKFGVARFSAQNEPFDPEMHEALNQLEVAKKEEDGLCVQEYQPGYMMKDRLLRPAMVAVGRLAEPRGNPDREEERNAGTRIKVKVKD